MANNNIPLVRSNSVNDINTSIIAIKKELKTNGETDINVNVDVNYEVATTVEEGNSKPVTSGAVYDYAKPVDTVQDGNLKAVTSNAVFDRVDVIGLFYETVIANTALLNEIMGTLTLVKGFYIVIYTSGFVTNDGATVFTLTNGTGVIHSNGIVQQKYWRAQQICYVEVTSNNADINIMAAADYTAEGTGSLCAIRIR